MRYTGILRTCCTLDVPVTFTNFVVRVFILQHETVFILDNKQAGQRDLVYRALDSLETEVVGSTPGHGEAFLDFNLLLFEIRR